MHPDDIRQSLTVDLTVYGKKVAGAEAIAAFVTNWLDKHNAIIVQCSAIPAAHWTNGAHWGGGRGKWGEHEPYPPYGGVRKQYEDAVRDGPPTPKA